MLWVYPSFNCCNFSGHSAHIVNLNVDVNINIHMHMLLFIALCCTKHITTSEKKAAAAYNKNLKLYHKIITKYIHKNFGMPKL